MKNLFLITLILCGITSKCQNNNTGQRNKELSFICSPAVNFKIYSNNCGDSVMNKRLKQAIVMRLDRYYGDSSNTLKNIELFCEQFNDTSLCLMLFNSLKNETNVKNKVGVFYCLKTGRREYVGELFIFTEKSFNRFYPKKNPDNPLTTIGSDPNLENLKKSMPEDYKAVFNVRIARLFCKVSRF